MTFFKLLYGFACRRGAGLLALSVILLSLQHVYCQDVTVIGNVTPDDYTTWTDSTYLTIGYTSDTYDWGSVDVHTGSYDLSVITLGQTSESEGTLTVYSGATLNLEGSSPQLIIGSRGDGYVELNGSITSSSGGVGVVLGSTADSYGELDVSGTLDATSLVIGDSGTGEVTIRSGGVVNIDASGTYAIQVGTGDGTSSLIMATGSTLNITAGDVLLGSNEGSAVFEIGSSCSVDMANVYTATGSGSATITLDEDATWNVENLNLSTGTGSTSITLDDDSSIIVSQTLSGGDDVSFTINGGQVEIGSTAEFEDNGSITITSGGSFEADGAVTFEDSAAIALTESTFSSGGALTVGDDATLSGSDSTFTVDGCSLGEGATITLTEDSSFNNSGAIEADDDSSISLSDSEMTATEVSLGADSSLSLSSGSTLTNSGSTTLGDDSSITVNDSEMTTTEVTLGDDSSITVSDSEMTTTEVTLGDDSSITVSSNATLTNSGDTSVGNSASIYVTDSTFETTSLTMGDDDGSDAALGVTDGGTLTNTGTLLMEGSDSSITLNEGTMTADAIVMGEGATIAVSSDSTLTNSGATEMGNDSSVSVADSTFETTSLTMGDEDGTSATVYVSEGGTLANTGALSMEGSSSTIGLSEGTMTADSIVMGDEATISAADESTLTNSGATEMGNDSYVSVADSTFETTSLTMGDEDGTSATVYVSDGGTLTNGGALLMAGSGSAVSLSEGTMSADGIVMGETATIYLSDGSTLNNAGATELGDGSSVSVSDSEFLTLGLTMGDADDESAALALSSGATLTNTGELLMQGSSSSITVSDSVLEMAGATLGDEAEITLEESATVTNTGDLVLGDEGYVTVTLGDFNNSGSVTFGEGSTLAIEAGEEDDTTTWNTFSAGGDVTFGDESILYIGQYSTLDADGNDVYTGQESTVYIEGGTLNGNFHQQEDTILYSSVATFNVTGDYSMADGATLQVNYVADEDTTDDDYIIEGTVKSDGDVVLANGSIINVNTDGNSLTMGDYEIIQAAGNITDNGATLTVDTVETEDINLGFFDIGSKIAASSQEAGYDAYYMTIRSNLAGAISNYSSTNLTNIASALDVMSNNGTANSSQATYINRLYTLSSVYQLEYCLSFMTPEAYTTHASNLPNQLETTYRQLGSHLRRLDAAIASRQKRIAKKSSYGSEVYHSYMKMKSEVTKLEDLGKIQDVEVEDKPKEPEPVYDDEITEDKWSTWAQVVTFTDRQDTTKDYHGYKVCNAGFIGGVDRLIIPNLRLGALIGYTHSDYDFGGGSKDSLDVDQLRIGPYVDMKFGAVFVETALTFGYHWQNVKREGYDPSGAGLTAKADVEAWDISPYARVGYMWEIDDWTLTPSLALQYMHFSQNSASETGSAMAMDIDSYSTDSFRSVLAFEIAKKYSFKWGNIIPALTIGWSHEFADPSSLTSSFVGQDYSIVYDPYSGDADKFILSLGVTTEFAKNWSVFLRYDGMFSNNFKQSSLNLGLSTRF